MDEMVKIEESVLELVEEELDVKQSTEESDVKTEMKTSPRLIDVKNEIATDGKIDRIKRENQGCDDSSIFTNNVVKIEKDELEMHVEATVHHMDNVQLNDELKIKDDICADSESEYPAIKRIKTEHDTAKWNGSDLTMASMAVKADPDVSLLHTEFDIKDESYSNTTASVTKNELPTKSQEVVADKETDGDTFFCYHCEYAARSKRHLIDHMKVHRSRKYIYSCCYCDFRTNSGRLLITHNKTHSSESAEYEVLHMKDKNVDDNFNRGNTTLIDSETRVLNKSSSRGRRRHPTFRTSVSKKVLGCTKCTYQSTNVKCLREHLIIKHPEISDNRILARCIYCNKTFKGKQGLDYHIVKRHPDFIASVSSKIHECTQCTYKTTKSSNIRRHLFTNHPEVAGNRILSRCIYCNKTFKSKLGLDDHIVKRHPDFIASVSSKIHECTQCTYKTTYVRCLREHLMIKHPEMSGNRILSRCIYCNKTFKSKLGLDDHIVKKHPDFIASVSSKIHDCTQCTYKTTHVKCLRDHLMIKHPEISGNGILTRCIYCNKTFKSKLGLDDHIVKRHPDTITSVSSKIHEFTQCTYKTTRSPNIRQHLITNPPEVPGNRILTRCIYCNKTFKSKLGLDDHIVKRHPDAIASVSSKIHECTQCTYKTTRSDHIRDHLITKHPEVAGNRILSRRIYCNKTFRCIFCNKTFKRKLVLDNHIIKIHPDFIASVSSKIHECTRCTYKTTISTHIRQHLITNHPEVAGNAILSRCMYCNKTFTRKTTLDDHIIKTHPDFIASVSSKIHECTQCTYKSTKSTNIRQHLITNHHEIADNRILSRCIYCNKTFKSKPGLGDHIIQIHPDLIASVSRKVHECTKCSYKTILRARFNKHMLTRAEAPSDRLNTCMDFNQEFKSRVESGDHIIKMATHSEIAGNNTFLRCKYCNKTFPIKQALNDHILSEHPNSTASRSKIKEGTKCTDSLNSHMLEHSETVSGSQLNNADLKSKQTLDAYILREHPYFIGSGNDKINESTKCICKAT
ncbi:unnamed protein product [Callosobruchus maculatus]|uniref:C2H2-type domain-containing protein n=1 Tax=Callosobruchus maculatus TaxID=64391 RepID=A0A653BJZ0_CALMS|nr:unnamed protein product [Callosobruchus maculatus]